jgi:hypothetical protein
MACISLRQWLNVLQLFDFRCDCRTDEGRLLEGIRTEKLETVIPRLDWHMYGIW